MSFEIALSRLILPPDGVPGWQPVAGLGKSEQAAVEQELDQDLGLEARPPRLQFALGQELRCDLLPRRRVGHLGCLPREIEGVVLMRRWQGLTVEREAPVASKIVELRPRHDKAV